MWTKAADRPCTTASEYITGRVVLDDVFLVRPTKDKIRLVNQRISLTKHQRHVVHPGLQVYLDGKRVSQTLRDRRREANCSRALETK
jgi:hypothetical protein